VKSATKKRLIELGVEEAAAHKLATDRNMADIKKMSPDEVAAELNVSKDSQVHQDVMRIIADQGSRRRAAKKSRKLTIRSKAIDEYDRPELSIRFNPLNHVMVPHQELVGAANISEDEQYHVEAEALAPWQLEVMDEETGVTRLAKELLPKVLITDPAVQVIKEAAEAEDMAMLAADPDHRPLAAGWIADRVLKVVRRSPTAGTAVAYRLIVEGS
jgi:DNA-directed RNA polymerase subunit H (RpoH/RPB5)